MDTDIANRSDIFFEHFGIKPCNITCSMRDSLEGFWLSKEYEDNWIDDKGVEQESWGNYSLIYDADQWFGVDLVKYKTSKRYDENDAKHCDCTYERIAHGEGDTPLFALMGLFIDAEHLFKEGDLEYLRSIFTEDLSEYEKRYKEDYAPWQEN